MAALYIPGMRVEICDAEWSIQWVERCAELPQQDALGWDDIKHLPHGFVVIRTSPDETLPDEQGNNTVVNRETRYHAPFVKPDRERDYRLVWDSI